MNIGILAVDSNFPNLALMKISAYHKARGDQVEWYNPLCKYDKVYAAKVFTFMLFLSMFSRLGIFYWLAIALMIYSTWRMFSKNISARYAENQKYLNYRYQMAVKWDRFKKHLAQRKLYRFYKCPQCRQKVRVPKGRGKICITCPKCRTEFVKKS